VSVTPVSRDATVGALDALGRIRERVDETIATFLADRRAELAALDPRSVVLIDELLRLLGAGGKRFRPLLCVVAHGAAGGAAGRDVLRAAASLELLHTFALIHDDVMDGTDERRGEEASHVRFAREAPPGVDPVRYGTSLAILVGDLAAVLAERLLRTCGAPAERRDLALERFDRMRVEMAAGQYLDVDPPTGAPPADVRRVAALKTSSYTAEGPVLIGAALAAAPAAAERPLVTYARHVGEAFQLRDDVLDGDAEPAERARVGDLVDRAIDALVGAPLEPSAVGELVAIAGMLREDG